MEKIDFNDIKVGDNIAVDAYPNESRVTINSKIRSRNTHTITMWWYGGEFIIHVNDIKSIYICEGDYLMDTEELVEFFNKQ